MHGTIGRMQIMDTSGHSEITWDPEKAIEVRIAREAFDKLRAEGYSAFEVGEDGEKGTRMTAFNPEAGKVMMIPQLVGG